MWLWFFFVVFVFLFVVPLLGGKGVQNGLEKALERALGVDKSEVLAVELKLVRWCCRGVRGWTGAAVKRSSERREKFLGNLVSLH